MLRMSFCFYVIVYVVIVIMGCSRNGSCVCAICGKYLPLIDTTDSRYAFSLLSVKYY